MQKYKCDFTGAESDWIEGEALPNGWARIAITTKGLYTKVELTMCPEVSKKLFDKWTKLNPAEMKPTLAEMIEQAICDIAHDAAQDAVANS